MSSHSGGGGVSDGSLEESCGEPVGKASQVLIYGVSQPVLITARGGKEQISSFPSVPRSISGFPSISITSRFCVFERSCPSYLYIPKKVIYTFPSQWKCLLLFFIHLCPQTMESYPWAINFISTMLRRRTGSPISNLNVIFLWVLEGEIPILLSFSSELNVDQPMSLLHRETR